VSARGKEQMGGYSSMGECIGGGLILTVAFGKTRGEGQKWQTGMKIFLVGGINGSKKTRKKK